jgi:hypothetical protein
MGIDGQRVIDMSAVSRIDTTTPRFFELPADAPTASPNSASTSAYYYEERGTVERNADGNEVCQRYSQQTRTNGWLEELGCLVAFILELSL